MVITHFSVSNYKSITLAYKMDISNNTVLLGKNNEGKTNVLKALILSMDIISNYRSIKRRALQRGKYDWSEDYPIHLQNSKAKNKNTVFRLDFSITEEETRELFEHIGSLVKGSFSVQIKLFENNTADVVAFKRGKNTKTSFDSHIEQICHFISRHIDVQYVPAIRTERDALQAISHLVASELSNIEEDEDAKKYLEALDIIQKYEKKKLDSLGKRLSAQLKQFLPKVKKVQISLIDRYSRSLFRKDIEVEIDDGVLTNLSNKGDGVKSLVAIALLSQIQSTHNRIIIVDEPENHLHPEAIHYIRNVLLGLPSNNQIIISTHNPIFVNRVEVKSNIIVKESKAVPASRIEEIRKELGIAVHDNLQYANYIIVVEGLTDKRILLKYFALYQTQIMLQINNNSIGIRSIAGANNLKVEVMGLERYCCPYLVLLDHDSAGKAAKNEVLNMEVSNGSTPFRFFLRPGYENSEIEDLLDESIYRDYLLTESIDISDSAFKDKRKKWSCRIKEVASKSGRELTQDDMDNIKEQVSLLAESAASPFNAEGKTLLDNISQTIVQSISSIG